MPSIRWDWYLSKWVEDSKCGLYSKFGDEMVFSNYRPVSALPVFSKLSEGLVYNRLISQINENKLLYEYQFGFQEGKSTYLAIMMLLDKITKALDQGECVIGVFLDFWYCWSQCVITKVA